jgi:guanine deaminase
MFRAITDAIQVSKLRWRLVDQALKPITFEEAFYMATKGGGEFFGKVGSFEDGYEFDAVVLDDSVAPHPQEMNLLQRLERAAYLSVDLNGVCGKYVSGRQIL